MPVTIDISAQTVVLTGASRGIGAAIAQALLDAGATVIAQYHQHPIQLRSARCLPLPCNLAEVSSVITFWQQCCQLQLTQALPPISALVLNAGIALASPLHTSEQEWMDNWHNTMQVNLNAAALLAKLALPHFVQQRTGRYVWISSRAAFRGDTPDYWAYAASKAAMLAIHRSIARYHGKQGIRSFAIAPGFTRTDMAQAFIDAYGQEHTLSDIALERLTEPADVAAWLPWLLSGSADHATGTTIDINAGSYVR